MYRDLVPEANMVQLTNRAPIAHLAIERGLKAIIGESGGNAKRKHDLNELYRELSQCNPVASDYLDQSFDDAVTFFGYNINDKGFKQFRSLDDYLSKVGTAKSFNALRYWAIEEAGQGANPIPFISSPIHRELLSALWMLFLPSRRETVSDRVESAVSYAMFEGRAISYGPDDTGKEEMVHSYMNWLYKDHATCRSALKEAVNRNLSLGKGDVIDKIVREGHCELSQSKDPAVQYYMRTLTYIPKGSERRNPDAIPNVNWFNVEESRGELLSVGGIHLGFVERFADGSWEIRPNQEGGGGVSDIAEALADAKHYVVNRLTAPVLVIVNGVAKRLRIHLRKHALVHAGFLNSLWDGSATFPQECPADVVFWDASHGLDVGDIVSVRRLGNAERDYVAVLEGSVIRAAGHQITISGRTYFKSGGGGV